MKISNEERGSLHENCKGCDRTEKVDGKTACAAYIKPEVWWRNGKHCPLHSSFRPIEEGGQKAKVRVGQQKQNKKR